MANSSSRDIDVVRALEDRRYQAIVDADYDTFQALCHDRLVYTHSRGDRDSLTSYMEKLRNGCYRYHRIDHPVEDIILIGDTAVVLGEMNADITVNGLDKTLNNTALSVWIKEDRNWKLLAYQPTPRP
ncbi:ketosteroid isomerase-like protein [Paenarthrobacter nicotinovorans]|uniref:nuclear transport factor 2 family protein n=1 Tax=Paenarthrobacter nicotinovorans TaxID=29320 RepID=UPI00278B150D|nr:nuclear transport factor 2 family protein [Paenarthrobacter nicotinovorans]MDP9936765.1 ketosteroid isomerase-like protein [Paenarthrobacter nicotinovorans]